MLNKKIEYFVTLAECLSFTQAAAIHSVTQTAISQYIATLENKLKVRLFNRNAHSVSLTDAGAFFYQRVNFMLQYYDDTKRRMLAIEEEYNGYVKVGIGMYEYRQTEEFFSRFLMAHPEIKVDIFQYTYGTLVEKLKSGELDVILANVLCEEGLVKERFTARPMFEASNYLVAERSVAEKYPPGDGAAILQGECLVTNCEDTGPNSMTMLREMLQREFGLVPERIAQTNSTNAQLLMVRARHGVAIVPSMIQETADDDSLVRIKMHMGEMTRYEMLRLTSNSNEAAALLMGFDLDRVGPGEEQP